MVQYGRPSCSSWTESVRSSFGRTIVRRPSRQSDWTFMSSSMRLDVTSVCLQRASGWNLCVRMQSLHTPRCFELPLKDMHLILHLRGCGIPLVMLPQPCDPCRLLGLLHPASHGSDSSWDCRRVIHRTSPNEFDRHDLTAPSSKLINTWHLCCARYLRITNEHLELLDSQRSEHFILRFWRKLYLHEVQHPCSDRLPHELLRVRLFGSRSQLELHFELRSAECNAFCSAGAGSRRCSLRSDCSHCEMLSRSGSWCRSADSTSALSRHGTDSASAAHDTRRWQFPRT